MSSLFKIFYENVAKMPDKEAIYCDGQSMTYKEFAEFTCRYANLLIHHGVSYGDHIGIPMNNSIESVALIMAASCVGAGLVPINPTIPTHSVAELFKSGNVRHIIARSSFYTKMEKAKLDLPGGLRLCLDGELKGAVPFSVIGTFSSEFTNVCEITGKEILFLTMTSGSTGVPKPIALTQENKYQRSMAHVRLYDIVKEDRILAATPLYHSLAERLVILPLLIGATSVLLPRFTPTLWLKCVQEQKVTFTIAVSSQLSQIVQLLSSPFAPDISSLRSIVSSSALLEPHVRAELIKKLDCDFHEMYGTSEISTATSINFREAENKQKSVGRAIPEADIKILREVGTMAPSGEVGEIICNTKLLFDGYYRQQTMTEAAFEGYYFKTGDLGRMDADGYLYFAGRKKELIITGGINVYPYDIEQSVQQMDSVEECAAFAYPDDRLGEVVALAVVPKKERILNKRTIQVHCVGNLADFQQPHYIFILDSLPKNAMGKLLKTKIIEYIRTKEIKPK